MVPVMLMMVPVMLMMVSMTAPPCSEERLLSNSEQTWPVCTAGCFEVAVAALGAQNVVATISAVLSARQTCPEAAPVEEGAEAAAETEQQHPHSQVVRETNPNVS